MPLIILCAAHRAAAAIALWSPLHWAQRGIFFLCTPGGVAGRRLSCQIQATRHSISIWTVSSWMLWSALLNRFNLVFGTVGHRTLDLCSEKPIHTVILPDWTLKKWDHSNFAFQHCNARNSLAPKIKKNFWNPVRDSWGPHYYRAQPSRPILENCQNGTF